MNLTDIIDRETVIEAVATTQSRVVTVVSDHIMIQVPELEQYRNFPAYLYKGVVNEVKKYVRYVLSSLDLDDLQHIHDLGGPVDCNPQEWKVGPVDEFMDDFPNLSRRSHMVPGKGYRTSMEILEMKDDLRAVRAKLDTLASSIKDISKEYKRADKRKLTPGRRGND